MVKVIYTAMKALTTPATALGQVLRHSTAKRALSAAAAQNAATKPAAASSKTAQRRDTLHAAVLPPQKGSVSNLAEKCPCLFQHQDIACLQDCCASCSTIGCAYG